MTRGLVCLLFACVMGFTRVSSDEKEEYHVLDYNASSDDTDVAYSTYYDMWSADADSSLMPSEAEELPRSAHEDVDSSLQPENKHVDTNTGVPADANE